MLSRIRGAGNETAAATQEFRNCLAAVRKYFPGLLENMRPRTHRELRDARKKWGLTLAPGQASTDLPLITLTDPRIQSAVLNFGVKLGLALYYKHAGQVLPTEGAVSVRWYSNLQVDNDAIPRELADVMPLFPKLERARTMLSDQFFYRIGVVEEKTMATFLAMFRTAFALVGFASVDASDLMGNTGAFSVRPVYRWP